MQKGDGKFWIIVGSVVALWGWFTFLAITRYLDSSAGVAWQERWFTVTAIPFGVAFAVFGAAIIIGGFLASIFD